MKKERSRSLLRDQRKGECFLQNVENAIKDGARDILPEVIAEKVWQMIDTIRGKGI